jgi:hypothetical protein
MALPKRPPLTNPIPNSNIANGPEQYTVKAPYWDAPVEGGLVVTPDGFIELEGGEGGGNSDISIKGPWWNMPIGQGLTVNNQDQLTTI